MEKETLMKIKNYLTKEKSLEEVCSSFNLTQLEALSAISFLNKDDSNIVQTPRNGSIYFIDMGDIIYGKSNTYTLTEDEELFRFMAISDTRLCSNYGQLSILNDLYEKAYLKGIKHVFHCGDISEGLYSPSSPFFKEVFINDTDLQAKYIIDNYPYVEGIKTYFIGGDQDFVHTKRNKVSIGKLISSARDDMIYLGDFNAYLKIRNMDILLKHPASSTGSFAKTPYTVSYKGQRFLMALRSEDKPDIVLSGHYMQQEHIHQRDVHYFSVPGVVSTPTKLQDSNNHIVTGAYFIDVNFDKKGNLQNIIDEKSNYYITDKEDYLKAKKLVLKK